jgi:hypothetical protein
VRDAFAGIAGETRAAQYGALSSDIKTDFTRALQGHNPLLQHGGERARATACAAVVSAARGGVSGYSNFLFVLYFFCFFIPCGPSSHRSLGRTNITHAIHGRLAEMFPKARTVGLRS